MGTYVDLHVVPPSEDIHSCERIADLLATADFSTVGLTFPTGLLNERIRTIRQVFEERGLNTVMRVDLKPSSRTELLRLLRRFRNQYDIVAVTCLNQNAATVSCRDRRVDLVFLDAANRAFRFNHTLAHLLRGAVEFNIASDLVGQSDGAVLSRIRKAIMVAIEHSVKIVLSSGARSYEMVRTPFQMSAVGVALGLNQESSIRAVSYTPSVIVAENQRKRGPEYVEEGVRMIVPSRR